MTKVLDLKKRMDLKKRIGERVRELRGDKSQEWLAQQCSEKGFTVTRQAIGEIERAATDYRIETLIEVLLALCEDESILFTTTNPLHHALHVQLTDVLNAQIPRETNFVVEAIEHAVAMCREAVLRSRAPPRKPTRSA